MRQDYCSSQKKTYPSGSIFSILSQILYAGLVLPSSLRAGAGIDLSGVLFAGAEAEMSSGKDLVLRTGFEYEAAKNLWLRGGFSSENTSFTFGLGYRLSSLKLDLAFATHYQLGITSGVSMVFHK